ncbi:MAG: cardiolipin synthase ClsB [Burkholderiales bacterium]|nr:cardiolipin synthase ClsB [Burkholderiales bacterium]
MPTLPGWARQAAWYLHPRPLFLGGNQVTLLRGGDALFPSMCEAIAAAQHEVWVASYIVHDDHVAGCVTRAMEDAVRRGVKVHLVADGFGSVHTAAAGLLRRLQAGGVAVAIFRPLRRWWSWLRPGSLRRLHMKLCVVDGRLGFVGGINLISDLIDLRHGPTDQPRLDYAVRVSGPVVVPIEQTVKAMWSRAVFGRDWRQELAEVLSHPGRWQGLTRLVRRLRMGPGLLPPRAAELPAAQADAPVRAAFVVRDNLRQRRTIERSYIEAIAQARRRIDIVCPYFYPGRLFRRALRGAARRGVQVRLLLQGKVDYRIAALAARVLYGELLQSGVRVFEYTPAFLHAKVAVVDDEWATVGSSNIDPLSLLVNLEANLVVRDAAFVGQLSAELERDFAAAREVVQPLGGVSGRLLRGAVAWAAHLYLRVAGIGGRY